MAEETSKLTLDISDVLAKLDRYEQRLQQIEKGIVDVAKAGRDASKSFVPEGDGAVKQLNDINKLKSEYQKLRTASDTLKTALKSAYDPRAIATYTKELAKAETGLKKLEQTGNAVGVNLKKIGKEGSLAADVVNEAFGKIGKATVILFLIDQVVKLTRTAVDLSVQFDRAQKSFTAFTGDAEKAARLVTDLQGLANKNILNADEVFKAGQSLLAFGESADKLPDVLNRIALISRATGKDFSELSIIYGKARTAGVLYAEDINQLVDAGIPIIREFAKQLGVSESQVKKLASEGKISFEELQLAFFNLSKEGSQFSKLAAEQANTLPNIWNATLNKLKPILKDIGDFFSNVLRAGLFQFNTYLDSLTGAASDRRAQQVANQVTDIAFGTKLAEEGKKKALVFIKQKSAEEIQLEKEAAAKRLEGRKLTAAQLAAQEKKLQDLQLSAMREGEAKEITQEIYRFEALKKELNKYHITTVDAEKQFRDNIAKIKAKYFLEQLEKDVAAREAEKESIQRGFEELTQLQIDNENKRQEALKTNSDARAASIAFDEAAFKQAELLSRQIFFSKKRTDKEIDDYNKQVAKAREIFQLKIQGEQLQRTLDFDTTLSDAEKASLRLRIQNINTAIAQLQQGLGEQSNGNKPKSIIELLGFKSGGEEDQALRSAVSAVKNAFDEITQARIAAADEQRRIADENVRKAEEALQKELDLQDQGFANNVSARQKDLDDAKRQQDAAIEAQRKAARQKAIIDAAVAANSLVTAGAQLFSAFSAVPFAGIALAIGAIATMVATIAKLRNTARQATQFRTGGGGFMDDDNFVAKGRAHESGGNLIEIEKGEIFQVTPDGNRKRFSVVRRENAREYHDLLDAANRGDKKALAYHAFALSGGELPEIDHAAMTKQVFGSSIPGPSKGSSEGDKNTVLLQKIFDLLHGETSRERFDGNVSRKGNTTKRYVNGRSQG